MRPSCLPILKISHVFISHTHMDHLNKKAQNENCVLRSGYFF